MGRWFIVLAVALSITGCAALSDWITSDAGGDPGAGQTRGEVIGEVVTTSSSLFGPFAGIAVIVGTAIAGMSKRREGTR